MFSLAKKYKAIKRLYVYTWFGGVTPRFDAGLVAGGNERKALAEIRKYSRPSSALRARGRKRSRSGGPLGRLVVRRAARRSIARSLPLRTILRISGSSGRSIAGTCCSANLNSMCVPPSGRSLSV